MHDVFKIHLLKDKMTHHKFESCATHEQRLMIGTSDGAVMLYEISFAGDHYECNGTHIERMSVKKPVTQICPIPDLNLALILLDGVIYTNRLADLSEHGFISNLKDCSTFAVKKDKGMFFLAAFLKKKILIFQYKTQEGVFVPLAQENTFTVPEGIKTLAWSGKKLLLGFKKEYVLLDTSGSAANVTTALSSTGRTLSPVICNLDPMRELILAHENVGVRVDLEGNPAAQYGVQWASTPNAVAYTHPYILSVHDQNSIEVRMPSQENSFCQTIPLKYVDMISQRGYANFDLPGPASTPALTVEMARDIRRDIIVVTTTVNSIHLLELIPLEQQVAKMAQDKRWQEALHIVKLSPGEISPETHNSILLQYGVDNMSAKNYEQAFQQFKAGCADPRFVISLYPDFFPPCVEQTYKPPFRIQSKVINTQDWNREEALDKLLRYLQPHRVVPPQPTSDDLPQDDGTMRNVAVDTAMLRVLVELKKEIEILDFLRNSNWCLFADTEQLLVSKGEWVALTTLYQSREDHHRALQLLRVLGQYGKLEMNAPVKKTIAGTPAMDVLAALIKRDDLPKHMMTQQFIEKKVREVAQGAENLDVITKQCVGILTTISYLKILLGDDPDHVELIKEFSSWFLTCISPSYSLKIFTDAEHPVEATDAVLMLESLPSESGTVSSLELIATYLQIVLGDDCSGSKEPELHNKRAAALIKLTAVERQPEERHQTKSEMQLLSFLEKSKSYDPQLILTLLQTSTHAKSLFRERAIVYRQLNMHREAIQMYLVELKSLADAEKYAAEVASTQGGEAYAILLQNLLRPDRDNRVRLADALDLINRSPNVDALTTLPLLPDETPICQLKNFLQNSLRTTNAKRCTTELYSSILDTLQLQVRVQHAKARNPYTTIETDSLCAVCRKKIRDTVFARYPNGVVVHQACLSSEYVCPQTHKDFRTCAPIE